MECLINLQKQVDELIKNLPQLNVSYDIEYVDCLGNKIDKK
jgi:hypothetical protein